MYKYLNGTMVSHAPTYVAPLKVTTRRKSHPREYNESFLTEWVCGAIMYYCNRTCNYICTIHTNCTIIPLCGYLLLCRVLVCVLYSTCLLTICAGWSGNSHCMNMMHLKTIVSSSLQSYWQSIDYWRLHPSLLLSLGGQCISSRLRLVRRPRCYCECEDWLLYELDWAWLGFIQLPSLYSSWSTFPFMDPVVMAIMYKAIQKLKQVVSYVASFSPAFFGAGRLKGI